MSKKGRFLLMSLVVVFLLPYMMGMVNAENVDDYLVDAEENQVEQILEEQAVDYVSKYVNTAYLYETEDFATGTVLKASDHLSVAEISENGTSLATSDMKGNLLQFSEVAEYLKYVRSAEDRVYEDFHQEVFVTSVEVNDDVAEVDLYVWLTFRYPECEEESACGDRYTVYFLHNDGEWIISDIYAEELESYYLLKEEFDCQAALLEYEEAAMMCASAGSDADASISVASVAMDLGGNNTMAYRAANAAAYAYTYTTTTYNGIASGNDKSFMSDYFGKYEKNCINFVSQCVWAGLGGNDSQSAVSNHDAPMESKWNPSTSSWVSCTAFLNYVQNYGGNTTDTTLRATKLGVVGAYSDFTGYSASDLYGAVLLLSNYGYEHDPDHALIVTSVSGTSRSDVYVCGNSPMRKNVSVADAAFSYQSIAVIKPQCFQMAYTNSSCQINGHTYPVVEVSPGTYSTTCQVCGYHDLRVVGTMLRPQKLGTTATIQGKTNQKCFRIAINITYPDGTNVWKEFTDTDTASFSYTFMKTGLYTVSIHARDLDPDLDSTSSSTYHTFKVRVY